MRQRSKIAFVFLPLLAAAFLFVSCDKERLIDQSREVANHTWTAKDTFNFSFNVPDTSTFYNFYVNFRNADDYPNSNIFVFIYTTFPNGKHAKDTLECVLTNPEGRWLGKGQGDLVDNQLPFKTKMRFPITGKYTMSIEQGMRNESLPGVYNVGLRIEKFGEK